MNNQQFITRIVINHKAQPVKLTEQKITTEENFYISKHPLNSGLEDKKNYALEIYTLHRLL